MADAVLVVGGTGKVGREVTRQLVEKGEAARVCTRNPAAASLPAGATAVAFDLGDSATWDAALTNANRLFLLAPEGELDPEKALAPLVTKAKDMAIERIVLMTAMGVDAYDGPYRRAEKMVADTGLGHTFIRPNWFMQNFDQGMFLDSIKQAGGLFLPAADARVSFVDTRDIAAMAVAALTEDGHGGKGYTVTGPRAMDHAEAMSILSEAAGKTITYTPVGDADMRAALAAEGVPSPMVDLYSELFAAMRGGVAEPVSTHVMEVLGREPKTLEAYAEEHAEVWR